VEYKGIIDDLDMLATSSKDLLGINGGASQYV
jgi:hypothetical protein